jgi:hypothetical protein
MEISPIVHSRVDGTDVSRVSIPAIVLKHMRQIFIIAFS